MNGVQKTGAPPLMKIITHCAFGREGMGKVTPATAIGQQIKNAIQNFLHVGRSWSSATMSGNEGLNNLPLGIGQI
jgi:hypothetical protein